MSTTIGFSEVMLTAVFGFLLFKEIHQSTTEKMKTDEDLDKLKARIAVLENELQLRDSLIAEYDEEYKTLAEENQVLRNHFEKYSIDLEASLTTTSQEEPPPSDSE